MAVPYGKREFCKAMNCTNLRRIEEHGNIATQVCREGCPVSAYKYHNWLQEQGYTIARFPTPFVIEEVEKNSTE